MNTISNEFLWKKLKCMNKEDKMTYYFDVVWKHVIGTVNVAGSFIKILSLERRKNVWMFC